MSRVLHFILKENIRQGEFSKLCYVFPKTKTDLVVTFFILWSLKLPVCIKWHLCLIAIFHGWQHTLPPPVMQCLNSITQAQCLVASLRMFSLVTDWMNTHTQWREEKKKSYPLYAILQGSCGKELWEHFQECIVWKVHVLTAPPSKISSVMPKIILQILKAYTEVNQGHSFTAGCIILQAWSWPYISARTKHKFNHTVQNPALICMEPTVHCALQWMTANAYNVHAGTLFCEL